MSENTENGLGFEDIDDLLNANMDDLDDLPPVGVPPSGHYNLTVTASLEDIEQSDGSKKKVPFLTYTVDAINQLKDDSEATEVAVGQTFREGFYMTKKDGTKNTFAIGNLKNRLKPHAERFGTSNVGELIQAINQIAITASIKRTVNRMNADQFNMQMKDIVLL